MSLMIKILNSERSLPPENALTVPENFAALEAGELIRYEGNPIAPLSYQAATWKARQTHFPIVIEDPFDSTKLIMFYGGGSVYDANYSIGRATSTKADPYTWTDYGSNPVIDYADYGNGPVVGPDDVWWNEAENRFEMHACTYSGDLSTSWLGLYYSDDGFTWTYEGVSIGPTSDETFLGNGAILRDGDTWYCYYTYRISGSVLPGIRVASSVNNGASWTKHGNVLTTGSPASVYDGKYIEGLQALKIGSDYVLNYGCSQEVSGLITYQGAYAVSSTPTSGFTKSSVNPFFTKSASGWDNKQISTAIFCTILDPWLMFYQGTNTPGDYNYALWSMGVATLQMPEP